MKTSFRNTFLVLAFLIACASKAQEKSSPQPGGGGGFMIGYGYMDVTRLHDFVPAGVGEFSPRHLLIGGSGHTFQGHWVIGGGGFGIIGDKIITDSLNYSLGGGLGTFDIGYLVLNKEKVKIYPMLGLGGGGYGIRINGNRNVSTTDVVSNPGHEMNINTGGLLLDASLNLNFIPVMHYNEKEKTSGGMMWGLKIGYVLSIPSSNWTFTGGDVTGGPKFGLNMPYVKLIIGGMGSGRR